MEWKKVRLGEVLTINGGFAFKSQDFIEKGIPVIKIGNLLNNKVVLNEKNAFVSNVFLEIKKEFLLTKGDVLIALSGATVGKVGVYNLEEKAFLNQRVGKINVDKNKIYSKFCFYFLDIVRDEILKKSMGAAQPNISPKELENLEIPLPPMDIQIKIVNTLDKVQELIDNKKTQLEKYDELLQSVFIEMFGDPVTNTKEWKIKKLQEVLYGIDNGWSPKCNENRASLNKWGVLKLSSVTGGKYKQEENKELPTNLEPKLDKEVKEGDLLMTRKNTPELVGDCAYIFETRNNLMMSDLIFRFNTKNIIDKKYLWKLFTNGKYKQKIKELASGSAKSMSNISKAKLQELKIILPPLELQNKFASIVEKVENEKKLCEESLKQMEEKFNSIMDKAFKGELF
ncbi:MAG: restriction endonuclease subunit S [Cetobacterium sp.]